MYNYMKNTRIGDYVKVDLWYFKKPQWFRVIGSGRHYLDFNCKKFHKTWIISGNGLTSCHTSEIKAIDRRRFKVFNLCRVLDGKMWRDNCLDKGSKQCCKACDCRSGY
jgi:hypothetical protein